MHIKEISLLDFVIAQIRQKYFCYGIELSATFTKKLANKELHKDWDSNLKDYLEFLNKEEK